MKIVVLAGGLCPERDVSLLSGTKVCNALRQNGHQAVMVDIYMGLPGYQQKDLEALFEMDGSLLPDPRISSTMPDLNGLIELCRLADICFMGLHGGIGENGMLQATLDVLGIKYTGASSLASALAMHKGVTKQILSDAGVPNARGRQIHEDDRYTPLSELGFQLPCVVKVCSGGSSLGVYIPETETEYESALDECCADRGVYQRA